MSRDDIQQLITAARLEAGFTQSELATLMGTTQSAIARMEGGRYSPTFTTLEKLAEVTGKRLEIRLL
jgi:transcriptional regulator with XRE-family HTH domain